MKITYNTTITPKEILQCQAMLEYSKEDNTNINANLDEISVTAHCTLAGKATFICGFAVLHPVRGAGLCGMDLYVRPNKRNMNIGYELAKIALYQINEMGLKPYIPCLHPASKIILAKLGLCAIFEGTVNQKPVYVMGYKTKPNQLTE